MQLHQTKAALILFWVLAVVVGARIVGLTSTPGWMAMAALAAIPAGLFWLLWSPPVPSMSESIRAARDE